VLYSRCEERGEEIDRLTRFLKDKSSLVSTLELEKVTFQERIIKLTADVEKGQLVEVEINERYVCMDGWMDGCVTYVRI
jgi:hypothetical protein